jgi:sugar lactone lactonase YvrE
MIAPAGEVSLVLDARCQLGEGPVWDPVGRCVYFVDILRGHVHRFDPVTGASRAYPIDRMVGAAALTQGAPDGMTLDAEGCVWVALWGGGADLSDLYITTASIKLSAHERAGQPGAGGLFLSHPGVRGRAPHRFKG